MMLGRSVLSISKNMIHKVYNNKPAILEKKQRQLDHLKNQPKTKKKTNPPTNEHIKLTAIL